MGIEALYLHPRTSKPEPGHKVYPYLLRGMENSSNDISISLYHKKKTGQNVRPPPQKKKKKKKKKKKNNLSTDVQII